ncbi:hypothetical protein F2Q69_00021121 [Brassica cretica]|uniref:Uncharacterized protein n=1 Tax=Brassica cretica TaxID=69181 RepID=A0A8S9QA59_BRACR|nr:hypothetical protein F2Q69_00021121 [Brassica cretica]
MHGLVSYRRFGRARSLHSDRAGWTLGRYRLSETDARSLRNDRAWFELGRYIATERDGHSVATYRPSLARARSLRSVRAVCMLSRRVSIELGLSMVRLPYSSLSAAELDTCLFPSVKRYLVVRLRFEQDFTARLFVKISLRRLLFRKNVHADFCGLSDIDSVVTDVDPNMCKLAGFSEDVPILAKRQILGSRIRVFDTMPRDVRDQCAGFRARPRFTPGFRECDD